MKQRVLILFLLVFPLTIYSQSIDKLFEKIEKKIKEDNTYLNLYEVQFSPLRKDEISDFQNIPKDGGGSYSFTLADGVNYHLIYLPENVDFNDPILLLIKKETPPSANGGQQFFGNGPSENVFDQVLDFRDIQNLYFNHRSTYDLLITKIKKLLQDQKPKSLLDLQIDNEVKKSRGISAPDNLDFLNFSRVNSPHMYPPKPSKSLSSGKKRFVRPGSKSDVGGNPFRVSGSFDRATFFYKDYMEWDNNSISAELNFNNSLLNLLPWQPMTTSFGIRSLIFLSGDAKNLTKDFIIDASIFGRFRLNTSSLVTSLPWMFSEAPKLNVGSGVELNASITRAFGLPFFNFHFSSGTEDYDNPYAKFGKSDSSYAYFSFNQWLASMSFYWNTSQLRNLRMRVDVGLGRFDISKAVYYKGTRTQLISNGFQPYLKLFVNFVPKGNQLFAGSMRLFDSVLKFDFWLQLLKIKPDHTFRLSVIYISEPLFRVVHEWENRKSTMIGINYRWGF